MILEKDTYWVTLNCNSGSACARNNYCFKQRDTCDYSQPMVDIHGNKTNSNSNYRFNKTGSLKDWRLATQQEIEEYDRRGEPYNITELPQEPIDTLLTMIL